jgi:hypothetical protein
MSRTLLLLRSSVLVAILVLVTFLVLVATARSSSAFSQRVERSEDNASLSNSSSRPLATGIVDPWVFSGGSANRAFDDVRRTGSTFVRFFVDWSQIAPTSIPLAAAEDPSDSRYLWQTIDTETTKALAHGITPIVCLVGAPEWAKVRVEGSNDSAPDSKAFAAFAKAAARRYSGKFKGLPRVRYWQVWNEPNLAMWLAPQRVNGKSFSPGWYRSMVVAFANAVKSVASNNVVVAGALAPYAYKEGFAPLEFLREFFCLAPDLSSTCETRLPIDVWGVHPYTSGGPTQKAQVADNLSLGDLPALRKMLRAAIRLGHVSPKLKTWTTEFSWDTNPPDPEAIPMATHARWVAEALHVMWINGISNVIWFELYDQPQTKKYDSGLYFAQDVSGKARPKLSLRAFRFPFVAYPTRTGIAVWGRTPTSARGTVIIEIRRSGRWGRLGTLKANAYGIFKGSLRTKGSWTHARARRGNELSVSFTAKPPPDPGIISTFGS